MVKVARRFIKKNKVKYRNVESFREGTPKLRPLKSSETNVNVSGST